MRPAAKIASSITDVRTVIKGLGSRAGILRRARLVSVKKVHQCV
jgi:hypothetical protein